jgi:hypothetical protein
MEKKLVVTLLVLSLVFSLGAVQAHNVSLGPQGDVLWIPASENDTTFYKMEEPMSFSGNYTRINGTCNLNLTYLDPMNLNRFENTSKAEFNFTDPTGMTKYGVILRNVVHVSELISFSCPNITSSTNDCTEPTAYAYGTVWGVGEFYVDGTLVSNNRVIQVLASERVNSSDKERYELIFDKKLPRKDIEIRLLLPDMVITENGTTDKQPVPINYTLPDGQNQSVVDVIFRGCQLEDYNG